MIFLFHWGIFWFQPLIFRRATDKWPFLSSMIDRIQELWNFGAKKPKKIPYSRILLHGTTSCRIPVALDVVEVVDVWTCRVQWLQDFYQSRKNIVAYNSTPSSLLKSLKEWWGFSILSNCAKTMVCHGRSTPVVFRFLLPEVWESHALFYR